MGRLVGYMANRVDCLADALRHEHELIAAPDDHNVSGWGIGFYQGHEVLHKKRPLLTGESLDWAKVAHSVLSDCVVLHLQKGARGEFRSEDVDPFRMRSWLFAQGGEAEGFEAWQGPIQQAMPDFLRRNIRGTTHSEHIFHLVLSSLHQRGYLDAYEVPIEVVLDSLREALDKVREVCAEAGKAAPPLSMILTNGRRMYALCQGRSLHYIERFELPVMDPDPLAAGPSSSRYLMIVSDAQTPSTDVQQIAEGSVLVVDRSLSARLVSL